MDSLNKLILLQIIDYLPTKDRSNLKLTSKKFNKIVDLSKDHHEWKLNKARNIFTNFFGGSIRVKENEIFFRFIAIGDSEDEKTHTVKTTTYHLKNPDWNKLNSNPLYKENRNLYESLTKKIRTYTTEDGYCVLNKNTIKVNNGILSENIRSKILYDELE